MWGFLIGAEALGHKQQLRNGGDDLAAQPSSIPNLDRLDEQE